MKEQNDLSLDGKPVKYIGVINSIKKKYTKRNTLMAFMTVEDLYGSTEIIVFDSCYSKSQHILLDENIVLIDGRLSIREDEDVKIVANNISEFNETVGAGPVSARTNTNHNANLVGVDALPQGHVISVTSLHSDGYPNIDPQTSKPKSLTINITNLSEEQKSKLRGTIKFFSGDKNNIAINVKNNEQILPCGAIYLNKEILEQFEEIVGKENTSFGT